MHVLRVFSKQTRGCAKTLTPQGVQTGAGKSTLLDILAMRIKQTSGDVLVDGVVRDPNFKKISTYLPQVSGLSPSFLLTVGWDLNPKGPARGSADVALRIQEESFVPTLTVWETLGLNSRLRLPMHIKPNERRMIMGKTLEEMGLFKVKDSQVRPGALRHFLSYSFTNLRYWL